ncbi:MAG: MFS transporter [Bifidobacteriaceae bacterium]|jgi:MFS family permease|nr:MFS transporter [Bifidobacteriaceae bacterium]
MNDIKTAPDTKNQKEPKGYAVTYPLANFGFMFAILTGTLGGLAVKLQHINNGDLSAATAQLALVTGVGALFALLSQPLVGRLSDRTRSRFGMRRPWIFVGLIGAALSLFLVGSAEDLPLILVGWCAAQTFNNFVQAAITATLPDQVPKHRRGIISGLAGMVSPIAILLGAISLNVLHSDLLRFAIPGFVSLIFGLLFVFTFRDRKLVGEVPPLDIKEFFTLFVFNPFKEKYHDLGWAWLSKFLVMFGYCTVGTYSLLLLATKFGMSVEQQTQYHMYINFISIIAMVIMSIVGGKLSDKFGKRRLFVCIAGITTAVGILFYAVSPLIDKSTGILLIFIGATLLGLGMGNFFATDQALCADVLPSKENTAKDLGVLNIANALPQSIAPAVAGPLILAVGDNGYTVWFIIGAIICVLGGAIVYKIKTVK